MKRRNSAFEKITSGKAFYISAAVAFCAIIVSVVIAYYSSARLGQEPSEFYDEPSTVYTLPAENNKTDVPDERENTEPDTLRDTEEKTTDPTTTAPQTTEQQTQAVNSQFALPSDGEIIKRYSVQEPVYSQTMGDWRVHTGVDFALNEGDEIHSVGNGTVTRVVSDTKWGYVIEIDYGSFTARYCGINQEGAVGIDTAVKAGDVIGTAASIPIESADGVHLHFEAFKDGKSIDPFTALGF